MTENKKGVAVMYDGDVPRVIAKASGRLFKGLVEIARNSGITIYQDSDLAEVLSKIPLGGEIPEDLFSAMVEVLAYCYRVNESFKAKIHSFGAYDV